MRVSEVVLGARDPRGLARFYSRLLGLAIATDEGVWVTLEERSAGMKLAFQHEPDQVPPVWPPQPGEQHMMMHLDVAASDLAAAVEWAIELGATLATHQPQDDVRVLIDPEGHPFCLFESDWASA